MEPLPELPSNTAKPLPNTPNSPAVASRPTSQPSSNPSQQNSAGQGSQRSSDTDTPNARTTIASAASTRARNATTDSRDNSRNNIDSNTSPTHLAPGAGSAQTCSTIETQAHGSRADTTLVDLSSEGLITVALPTGHVRSVLQQAGYSQGQVTLNAPASFCIPQAQIGQLMRPSTVVASAANALGPALVVRTRGGVTQLVPAPSAPAKSARTASR
jgi:hypothetical protein